MTEKSWSHVNDVSGGGRASVGMAEPVWMQQSANGQLKMYILQCACVFSSLIFVQSCSFLFCSYTAETIIGITTALKGGKHPVCTETQADKRWRLRVLSSPLHSAQPHSHCLHLRLCAETSISVKNKLQHTAQDGDAWLTRSVHNR